jgi:hypothetical protein
VNHSAILALAFALLACASSPSAAQDRGYVGGQVGVTFQSETAVFFGGEVGVNVAPAVQVYGVFGRMQDVLPSDLQDAIDAFAGDVTVDASIPAFFGLGGVRVIAPSGAIRPYALGGIGFARLNAKVEVLGLDITDALFDDGELSSTELMFEVGGGVMIPLGAAYIDAGYRFGRIATEESIDVSRVYGGLGVRF